jgi:DNA mismatch repair protein MutS
MKRAVEIMGIQLKVKRGDAPGGRNGWFAGFPESQLHKFAALLTRENWTVVVIEQTKDAHGKVTDRPVARILSPGTHVEASAGEAFYLGGLWVDGGTWTERSVADSAPPSYAAVAIDLTTGAVITFQGTATGRREAWHSDELLHFFQVHPVKELTIWWRGHRLDCPAEGTFRRVLGCPAALLHIRDAADSVGSPLQKAIVREDLLRRCYAPKSLLPLRQALGIADQPAVEWVLCVSLLFIEDHFPSAMEYLHTPRAWNPREAMVLGNHALTQLNLLTTREEDSVLGLFLRTYTVMGRRAMRQRLLIPGCLPAVITRRLDEIAWSQTEWAHTVEPALLYLRQVQDLARLHRRMCLAQVVPVDILALDQSYGCIQRIAEKLVDTPLAMTVELCDRFATMRAAFAATFSVEKAMTASEEQFCLTDEAGPAVAAVEESIRKKHAKLTAYYKGLVEWLQVTPDMLRLDFKEASVQLAGGKKLMESVYARLQQKGVPEEYTSIRHTAKKSSASMDVPFLQATYQGILGLRESLAKAVRVELPPLCDRLAAAWGATWDDLEAWISHVDVTFTLARVATERGFCRPVLQASEGGSGGGAVHATGLRHPLIEAQQVRTEYVRHDVELGVEPSQEGWLVYGMNASGKSSLMKAVGIAVLLAQCGCFVPAETFTLNPFHALYTRILNTDNLWAGLSSFAVEMTELREILARADRYALVLGDEVCSGTESESATALVAATLTYFQGRGVRYIFATHLHGLQGVKEVTGLPGLRTWHLRVRHDAAADRLIYERTLHPGAGSSLYGLEVAKAMGLPAEVLESARRIRRELAGAATEAEAPASAWNTTVQRRACEICKAAIVRDLEVHHIRPRAEAEEGRRFADGSGMNALRNLVVVCQGCHDAHHAGGLHIGPVQQTSDGPVRSIKDLSAFAYTGTAAAPKKAAGGLTTDQVCKVEEYLRKYPLLPAKRVAFDLLEREGIKVTEARLRAIRAELQ